MQGQIGLYVRLNWVGIYIYLAGAMTEQEQGVISRLHQQFEITFAEKEQEGSQGEEQGDAGVVRSVNPEHQKQPTLNRPQQQKESIPIADISPPPLQSIPEQPFKPQQSPYSQPQPNPFPDDPQQPQQFSISLSPQAVEEEEEHLEMNAITTQQMYHEPEDSKLCHSHLHQQETAQSHEEEHFSDIRHCSPVLFKNRTQPNELVTLGQLDEDQGSEIKPLNLEMSTEDVEHQELMSYRALTEKFEMALSKSKHTVSSLDFAARQDDYLKKKKSGIDHLRKEKDQLQKSRCSGKPLINSRSQHLLGYRPIQRRYKEVLNEKQKKVQTGLAEKRRREKEEQEKIVKEMEEHQQKVKSKIGTVRTNEAYYGWMQTWSEERNKKVEELAARRGLNTQQDSTFKPQLNEKSQAMMRKKVDRVPIYQKQPVARKVGVDKNCTFKPNLNKTIKK